MWRRRVQQCQQVDSNELVGTAGSNTGYKSNTFRDFKNTNKVTFIPDSRNTNTIQELVKNTNTNKDNPIPDSKDTNKNISESVKKKNGLNRYFFHTGHTCHNGILPSLMPRRFPGPVELAQECKNCRPC